MICLSRTIGAAPAHAGELDRARFIDDRQTIIA
jgi:hypothetical protein